MNTFKEYQDRFSNFREHKDKMFNIWVPFGQVDWWDLAMTTKGSAPNDGDEDFKIVDGKGPGNWWYYPNMTGIFQPVSEAMVFKSHNVHSGVKPPDDSPTFGDRQSVECRFLEDDSLPAVTLKEARQAARKISEILGHSSDRVSTKAWELLNQDDLMGFQIYEQMSQQGELPLLGEIYQRLDRFSKQASPLQPVKIGVPKVTDEPGQMWHVISLLLASLAILVITAIAACAIKKHRRVIPDED